MMHSALPIIVSDVDGLKEMVNDDCGIRIKVDLKEDKVSINEKDKSPPAFFHYFNHLLPKLNKKIRAK
ncbi:hypothetical protein [Pedobacter sp.]|uniref:hypothetical protein n=1 Tax=Pedobacter sp. TaxID=1411316 RepID=UPI003BAC0FAD